MSRPKKLGHDKKICCMQKSVIATLHIRVATCKTSPTQKSRSQHQKMKLQKGNKLSGGRTLSRQTFWVVTKMTIIQDSVATRTGTELLSRQEKLCHNTNLKMQLSITVAIKKTLSRMKSKEEHRKQVATYDCLLQQKPATKLRTLSQ